MTRRLIFLTHANVVQDPYIPVPDWPLNDTGRARHAGFNGTPALADVTAIYCSAERKARDGAEIHGAPLGITPQIVTALHENDRSATGYLPPEEFQSVADQFFATPDASVRGWERARAAQARVVAALRTLLELDQTSGDVLVVAHGAVGALLRCHLKGIEIARPEDQPPGGGCWFTTNFALTDAPDPWNAL